VPPVVVKIVADSALRVFFYVLRRAEIRSKPFFARKKDKEHLCVIPSFRTRGIEESGTLQYYSISSVYFVSQWKAFFQASTVRSVEFAIFSQNKKS